MFDKPCPKCGARRKTNSLCIDKPISVVSPQEIRRRTERLLVFARVH